MESFFQSPLFYTTVGLIIGGLTSYLFQSRLEKNKLKLRLREKSIHSRHQAFLAVIRALRKFTHSDFHPTYVNKDGGALYYTKAFESPESFNKRFEDLMDTWREHEHEFDTDTIECFNRIDIYLSSVKRVINEGGSVTPILAYFIHFEIEEYFDDCIDNIQDHLDSLSKHPEKRSKGSYLPEGKVNYEKIVKDSVIEKEPEVYVELLKINGLQRID